MGKPWENGDLYGKIMGKNLDPDSGDGHPINQDFMDGFYHFGSH